MSKHVQSVNAGAVGSLVARAGIAAAAVLVLAAGVHAQWLPDYQRYEVKRAGLFGPAHTHPVTGAQDSTLFIGTGDVGRFAGYSERFGSGGGWDPWYWDGQTTHMITFGGPEHYGPTGEHYAHPKQIDATGLVAGIARRYRPGLGGLNGYDVWGWKNGVAVQISLDGGPYRGSNGYQNSPIPDFQLAPGYVVGSTDRITGENTRNGESAWVWDGNTVHVLGFSGPGYTTATNYHLTKVNGQSSNGYLVGATSRFTPADVGNGRSAWFWNGATTEIGLMDAEYVGSAGYRNNWALWVVDSGLVVGNAQRVTGVSTTNGQDTWAWNAGATTRIGLVDPVNTGSGGFRSNELFGLNSAGYVTGTARRITGVNTSNGVDAWVWFNGTTTRIGMVGPGYTGSNGYQWSEPVRVALNEAGQIKGHSRRVLESGQTNGQDAWVWKNGVLSQIGLTGGVYEGTAGFRSTRVFAQNEAGQAVGGSALVSDLTTIIGEHLFFWNGAASVRIDLSGADYVGSEGQQSASFEKLYESGQVLGTSTRYLGESVRKGGNVWVWNGTETVLIGLVGPEHTRSDGYQLSELLSWGTNAHGVVIGHAIRYGAAEDENGQDVWYFDPATGTTHDVLAGVAGRVRTADGFAFSEVGHLTESGVLVGTYRFFAGGVGDGEERAFAYRPDLGFTHLEDLVVGGVGAYGWEALQRGAHAAGFDAFVGYGRTTGQTQDGRHIFVMTEIDCLADFDGSGSATIDDLFQFMNAWFMGDPRADANGQNGVTIDDLFIFLNAWFTGC